MLGARLLAATGATFVDAQIGRGGYAVTPPRQRGALAGDYAIWARANPPNQSWALLSSSVISVYAKMLGGGDLDLNIVPADPWALAIYRDPTGAAAKSAAGFAKAGAHVGLVAILEGSASAITSPAGVQSRAAITGPDFAIYDLVGSAGPYPDMTPFKPGDETTWTVLELLRS